MKQFKQGFIGSFKSIFSTKPLFSTLILAVILYGFFYPAAYKSQVASQLPIVVVNQDQTQLSQQIVERVMLLRAVKVIEQTTHFADAEQMVRNHQADAIFMINPNLQASLLHGDTGGISLYLSGAYLIRTKEIGKGLADTIKDTLASGADPLLKSLYIDAAVPVESIALYNPTGGYGDYIFPAVSTLIVHQTLLLGVGMLVGLYRQQHYRFHVSNLLGISLAFMLIGCCSCLYYFGFVFWLQDYPRGHNLWGSLLAVPVYVFAVVMLGIWLGSLFDRPERVAQVLTFSSLPLFFLSGASWPLEAMPQWMATLAWCLPSTAGVRQFIQLNQMGASVMDVLPNLLILLSIGSICMWLGFRRLIRGNLPLQQASASTMSHAPTQNT